MLFRDRLLREDPIDITPRDGRFFFHDLSNEEIERDWSFKPVRIRGVFNHQAELRIPKERNGTRTAVLTLSRRKGTGNSDAVLHPPEQER